MPRAAYERALKIDEKAFGPDHPIVATGVNNLGIVLQALGDLPGAKAAYERALQDLSEIIGRRSSNTGLFAETSTRSRPSRVQPHDSRLNVRW